MNWPMLVLAIDLFGWAVLIETARRLIDDGDREISLAQVKRWGWTWPVTYTLFLVSSAWASWKRHNGPLG